MDIIKSKYLPNHATMIGYFSNENKDSLFKINVKKYIYIKKNAGQQIELEARPLSVSIHKGREQEQGLEFKSAFAFGDKRFDKTNYYSSDIKEDLFNKKTNKTLSQIWDKPMSFEEVRKIVDAFVGNSKNHPLDFRHLRSIQSEMKDNWESMQFFILSGEIEDPTKNSFGMMLDEFECQR